MATLTLLAVRRALQSCKRQYYQSLLDEPKCTIHNVVSLLSRMYFFFFFFFFLNLTQDPLLSRKAIKGNNTISCVFIPPLQLFDTILAY